MPVPVVAGVGSGVGAGEGTTAGGGGCCGAALGADGTGTALLGTCFAPGRAVFIGATLATGAVDAVAVAAVDDGLAVGALAVDALGAFEACVVVASAVVGLRLLITANAPPPIASSAPTSTTGRTHRVDPGDGRPGTSTGSSAPWVPSPRSLGLGSVERSVLFEIAGAAIGAANGGEIAVGA